jgi:hypothetical protein
MDSSPEKKVPKPHRCNARLEDFIQVNNMIRQNDDWLSMYPGVAAGVIHF